LLLLLLLLLAELLLPLALQRLSHVGGLFVQVCCPVKARRKGRKEMLSGNRIGTVNQ
jgi:hypothetical protein